MDDPPEKKTEPSGEQNPNDGFSFLDMLDLSPHMHLVMRLLIPTMELPYLHLCEVIETLPEAERLTQSEIDETLRQLSERGYVTKEMSAGELTYRVAMGRRKARTNSLDKEIWDSLGWDEKP